MHRKHQLQQWPAADHTQDGRVHTYFNVPRQVVEELENAGSAGAYYNAYIEINTSIDAMHSRGSQCQMSSQKPAAEMPSESQ